MKTTYEGDIETWDENDQIEDHDHTDKLFRLPSSRLEHLVLVRDTWDEYGSLNLRLWAYAVDNKLPEYFEDCGEPTGYKVPQKYHKELERFVKKENKLKV